MVELPAVRVLGWLMGLTKRGRELSATGTRHLCILRQLPAVKLSDRRTDPCFYTWVPCSSTRLTVAPEKDGYQFGKRCKRCLAYADSERGRTYINGAINR